MACKASVQAKFHRGIALLHSFGYNAAQAQFRQIEEEDPACAMAYWGDAMTLYRQLWDRPSKADLEQGHSLIEKAKESEEKPIGSALISTPPRHFIRTKKKQPTKPGQPPTRKLSTGCVNAFLATRKRPSSTRYLSLLPRKPTKTILLIERKPYRFSMAFSRAYQITLVLRIT